MFLYQTIAIWKFLSILAKIDPGLTTEGTRNLILILPSKWVETNTIAKIIEFPFQ